jgi:hypothetical protein
LRSRILGIAGLAGSGKDTVANMLRRHFTVAHLSFADPLKQFCGELFGWDHATLYGSSEKRNAPDPRYVRADGELLTPRYALQTLGTEWGRNCYPNIWVDYGVRRAAQHLEKDPRCLVVFTDCRFTNEAEAIRSAGGDVLFISRREAGLKGAAGVHSSEQEMLSDEYQDLVTHRIHNGWSMQHLEEAVAHLAEGLR